MTTTLKRFLSELFISSRPATKQQFTKAKPNGQLFQPAVGSHRFGKQNLLMTQHGQSFYQSKGIGVDRVNAAAKDKLLADTPIPTKFVITRYCQWLIQQHLSQWNGYEDGGIVFCPLGTNLATTYVKDSGGQGTSTSLRINFKRANRFLQSGKHFSLSLMAVIHAQPPTTGHQN